ERMRESYLVLWWVPKGHRPDIDEAITKLNFLRANGPTESAFTFRHPFPAPDATRSQAPITFGDACPAT
ncbi:MAG: DUF3291 domain-containing protein, partial [Usitatibacteraceae bacterium]